MLLLDGGAAADVWRVASRLGQEAIWILRRVSELPAALQSQAFEAVLSTVDPESDVGAILRDLVDTCADHSVRAVVSRALEVTCTARIMLSLRGQYCLTWREIQVLLVYYLESTQNGQSGETLPRYKYAHALGVTENTLKVHIANLRRKLALPDHATSRSVVHHLEHLGLAPALVR